MKVHRKDSDRISELPQDTIEKILTLMPIRDALRTSILSRKWRYSWRTIPKLAFDYSLIVPSDNFEIDNHKFVKAIFHVLLLHRGPILEFSLSVDREICTEIDQMILHLSSRNIIKKIIFNIMVTDSYHLPCSFFSLQGLEHIDLSHCTFEPPLMNKGFSMLKRLHFCECYVTSKMLLGFLTNCPLLEEFTWSGDYGMDIELTESELLELFKCFPSVQVFEISMLHIKHLAAGSMPHKLSISLPHLRILDLHMCYLELSSVLCVIRISPKLEKMKLEMCWDHDQCLEQTFNNLHELQDYMSLNLDHFKEVEITRFGDPCGSWMEFVKVVMGRSPMLKRATIELCKSVSIDKEVEMYQDLVCLPFLRASPTAKFIIKRPKNYCR